jgi:hypothetical protein
MTVGPRDNPELSVSSLKEALRAFGYSEDVKVIDSQIPLRRTKTFT